MQWHALDELIAWNLRCIFLEIDLTVEIGRFEIGGDHDQVGGEVTPPLNVVLVLQKDLLFVLGKSLFGGLVIKHRQSELLEIIRTLISTGCLAGRLNRRKQQRDEHANDGDHHEQLDKRKTARTADATGAMVSARVGAMHGTSTPG